MANECSLWLANKKYEMNQFGSSMGNYIKDSIANNPLNTALILFIITYLSVLSAGIIDNPDSSWGIYIKEHGLQVPLVLAPFLIPTINRLVKQHYYSRIIDLNDWQFDATGKNIPEFEDDEFWKRRSDFIDGNSILDIRRKAHLCEAAFSKLKRERASHIYKK